MSSRTPSSPQPSVPTTNNIKTALQSNPPRSSSQSSKSVLIVGAGPTGLTLGIELARRQVPLRLIDKNPHPEPTSRAFTLHSRTLEAFDTMVLTSKLIQTTNQNFSSSMQYHFIGDHKKVLKSLKLDFGRNVIRGRRPGILTIPQGVTESVLREEFERLGGKIEWGVELTRFTEKLDYRDNGNKKCDYVSVELKKKENTNKISNNNNNMNGNKTKIENEKFDYLIGCDGSKSRIRKQQNLKFSGLQYVGMTLKMMDVDLSFDNDHQHYSCCCRGLQDEKYCLDDNGYHYFIKEKSMLLFVKLAKNHQMMDYDNDSGENTDVWRVLLSTTEENPDLSVEAFQKGIDDILDGIKLGKKPYWTVSYRLHKRMVSQYISESSRILLAGDAAHINSPAGGQGMNTAIQDGFNLGWKLAMVCKGLAMEGILKTYEVERRPIAKKVLEGTDLLHEIIMAHGKKLTERIDKASEELWLEKAVLRISGQAFSYGDQEREDVFGNDVVVADGDQAPDILVVSSNGSNIERLTASNAPFYILVVFDDSLFEEAIKLKEKYAEVLTIVKAAPVDCESTMKEKERGPLDPPSDTILRSQYGTCVAALIRPDRYIQKIIKEPVDIGDAVIKSLIYSS